MSFVQLFGNALSAEYDSEADRALHLLFASLQRGSEAPFAAVAANLYRLYVDGWEGARTFFFLCTGMLIDRDVLTGSVEEITVVDPHRYTTLSMTTKTCYETCETIGGPLCQLHYSTEDDEEEDDESDTEEET
tara:strand:+ start:1337 stop:1735 length:399 start_codon:yes stop_codon:yes gene_type:complete